jgi:hypothetical protein
MKLYFKDGTTIDITLSDSVLKPLLIRVYSHLQYISPPVKEQDWINFSSDYTIDFLANKLVSYASKLGIPVDRQRCISNDQLYFNYLHQIYEKNYNGHASWEDYHELIHSCENYFLLLDIRNIRNTFKIDYIDAAGLLETKFNQDWLQESVTNVRAGQVYCKMAELGKTPYTYWSNGEPNDIDRINELAKPWCILRSSFHVALEDFDYLASVNQDQFNKWWKLYEKDWCHHWNLKQWSIKEMFSVIPVGKVNNLDELISVRRRRVSFQSVEIDKQKNTESLKFNVVIRSTWTTHPPSIEIKIDDVTIEKNIDLVQGINHISFDVDLFHKSHQLIINRHGATSLDRSQMITIEKLSIDNIDCDRLILTNSWFEPTYPEPWATEQRNQGNQLLDKIPFETVLGHNGTWKFDFACPVYPLLLNANVNQTLTPYSKLEVNKQDD